MNFGSNICRCTSRIRGEFKWQGEIIGEYEFLADHVAAYIAHRTDQDGFGPIRDLEEIGAWFVKADLQNPAACSVPSVWEKFNWLASEMLGVGLGKCYCPACRTHYDGFELESGSGWGSPGWIAASIKCSKGHEVLKLDLLKPFCSHTHVPETTRFIEQHIPAFLRK